MKITKTIDTDDLKEGRFMAVTSMGQVAGVVMPVQAYQALLEGLPPSVLPSVKQLDDQSKN